MRTLKEWPILEDTAKTGKTKYWQIRVVTDGVGVFTEVDYWQGEDGAHQVASKRVVQKNIGRANETTEFTQAKQEAESQFKKQKDKGYREKGEVIESLPLPMLAMDFKKQSHRIKFPCFGQPKLDGIRALTKNGKFWSRQGKLFPEACMEHLGWKNEYVLDGELILPAPYTFQQTCSAVKKFDPELSPKLEYHVFDVVTNLAWVDRNIVLQSLFTVELPEKWKRVETRILSSREEADAWLAILMEYGYEGLMLRNSGGKYVCNQRSHDLQKYKEFVDDEFEVVDIVDGKGREEGAAIYVCRTKTGLIFNVRPKGTYEERYEIFKNPTRYITKLLTVRYQNLTDEGVPRFPVGICVRDYE